jgi:hypothetical protein
MMPSAIFEAITQSQDVIDCGVTPDRVFELQSLDERPCSDGYFVVLDFQESTLYSQTYTGMKNGIPKAPRVMVIWVHTPEDKTRDYTIIDRILNRIDDAILSLEQVTGNDGSRVTCVAKQGRSRNLKDPGWKTITRNATYGVLYDESVA